VLRRDGFAISTAQAIDAASVLELVGFDDRVTLREALLSVIVERRAERATFRQSFDRFFAMGRAHSGDLWGRLRDRGFTKTELDALRELLEAAAERSGGGGDSLMSLAGSDSELDRLLLAAGIARALAPMTSELQAGFFAHRVMEALEVPKASSFVRRIHRILG